MEMDKELQKVIVPYISDRQMNILTYDVNTSNKLFNLLTTSKFLDAPDFYNIDEASNTCYMFEHFQVDASLKTKKGSTYKRRQAIAEDRLNKRHLEKLKNNISFESHMVMGDVLSETINPNVSIKYLKYNFDNLFNYHYKRLATYFEHIRREEEIENVNFVTTFVIEHTTTFGGFNLSQNNKHFDFCFADFVIEKIKECPEVDNYIFLERSNKQIVIINKKDIKLLGDLIVDTSKDTIFFMDNFTTFSTCAYISNKVK